MKFKPREIQTTVRSKTKNQKLQNPKPILINKIHQNTSQSSSVLDLVRSNHGEPPSHYQFGFKESEREREMVRFRSAMGFGHESQVFSHGFSAMRGEKRESLGSSTSDRHHNQNPPPQFWINGLEWNTGLVSCQP